MAKCATVQNTAKNGIEIKFAQQPDETTLAEVKRRGFKWSKFGKLWYKTFNATDWAWAQSLCGEAGGPIMQVEAGRPETRNMADLRLELEGKRFTYVTISAYDVLKNTGIRIGSQEGFNHTAFIVFEPNAARAEAIVRDEAHRLMPEIAQYLSFKFYPRNYVAKARPLLGQGKYLPRPEEPTTAFQPFWNSYRLWQDMQAGKLGYKQLGKHSIENNLLFYAQENDIEGFFKFVANKIGQGVGPLVTTALDGLGVSYPKVKSYDWDVQKEALELAYKDIRSNLAKYIIRLGSLDEPVSIERPAQTFNAMPNADLLQNPNVFIVRQDEPWPLPRFKNGDFVSVRPEFLPKYPVLRQLNKAEVVKNWQYDKPRGSWMVDLKILQDGHREVFYEDELMPYVDADSASDSPVSPFGGGYFRQYPAKILGTYITHNPNTGKLLTDAWGKPRPEVRGTMQDVLSGMAHLPDGKRFEHFVPAKARQLAISADVVEVSDTHGTRTSGNPDAVEHEDRAKEKSNIEKAIRKTVNEAKAIADNGGKCDDCTVPLEDSIRKYNTGVYFKDANGNEGTHDITDDEIAVWITFQVRQGVYDAQTIRSNAWGRYLVASPDWRQWHSAGLVAYDGSGYVPVSLYYAGNVYDRIRTAKEREADIVGEIGQAGFDEQVARLEASKPRALVITDDPKRKLVLSPFHKIWDEVKIRQLASGQDVKGDSIGHSFYYYFLTKLSKNELTLGRDSISALEIYNYWVVKKNFPRETYSDEEKADIKRRANLIGNELFDRFLVESLTREDKDRIAAVWNATHNNWRDPDWHKIPVGFQVSKKFKGGELRIRPAQREGAAFLNHRGKGILGFDVGVGKTASAILTIEDGFGKGLFKRPLVVVPQKVIRKWVGEVVGIRAQKDIPDKGIKKGDLIAEGILPHRKATNYDNLGAGVIGRAVDASGIAYTVPEHSITFITFEALEKIGFSRDTEDRLKDRLVTILSQGESGRGAASKEQRAEKWIDKALDGTSLDIEDMGIDAIFVDEAQGFRNLFLEVKGDIGKDGEREKKTFHSQSSGEPSDRAVKLFMLNTYIQDLHNGRNTFGLTATPFTNRATEIYSILALFDYEGLKDFGCWNITQFCSNFIDETFEPTYSAKGLYEIRAVIRGYNNLPTLQALVWRSINYKTGQEVRIPRPEKVVMPLYNDEKGVPLNLQYVVDTKLPPSGLQDYWMGEIRKFARKGEGALSQYYLPDRKGKIPGQILIALGAARAATFSPFALRFRDVKAIDESPTPEEFIESSPKLKYVVECIRTVRNHHLANSTPVSGQIIYSDTGVEFFEHIKQYLIAHAGFRPEEIAVFHGDVSKTARENIKEGFLDNSIKVLIASSAIREGVDAQNHCSVIYVCHLDWNPTDLIQLMGRGWRFGNKHSHIRIVVPLIENSSDPMTWQKLSEKTDRINAIWTKADNTKMFEEGELNPEELKKSLINDPVELARFELEEERYRVNQEIGLAELSIKELAEAGLLRDTQLSETKKLVLAAEGIREGRLLTKDRLRWGIEPEQVDRVYAMELDPSDIRTAYRIIRAASKLTWNHQASYSELEVEQHIKSQQRLIKLQDTVLAKYRLELDDDFSLVSNEIADRMAELAIEKERIESDGYFEDKVQEITRKKDEERATSAPVSQRVNQFSRLNYLLDCRFEHHTCDIYGRVSEIRSGKVIEVKEAPKVELTLKTAYKIGDKLKRFMPPHQQALVNENLRGEESEGFVNIAKRLENEVDGIPKLNATKKVPTEAKTIHAHFFGGSTDFYVAEWDGGETAYAYTVLEGDTQMAEWGHINLPEIHNAKRNWKSSNGSAGKFPAFEMDFYWQARPFWQVMGHEEPRLTESGRKEVDKAKIRNPRTKGFTVVGKGKGKILRHKPAAPKILPNPAIDPVVNEKVKKAMIQFKADMEKSKMLEAADALRTALEFLEETEKESMLEAAEALETAVEFI